MTLNTTCIETINTKEKPLFLKTTEAGTIFTCSPKEIDADVSFRSLNLDSDIDLIHDWANKEYAKRFWQMEGTKPMIANIYRAILQNPDAHSFIGLINNHPFCQIDAYAVHADELAEHVKAEEGDCGLHLLMCPPREMKRSWTRAALHSFIDFYFSFPQAKRLFAEPDHENYYANKLALKCGFQFLKTIEMSNKTANLYVISRTSV